MDRKAEIGAGVIILVAILIVTILIVVIYLMSPEKQKTNINETLTINTTYYKIWISTNANKPIDYELKNESALLVKGLITNSQMLEQYENVANGSLLNLSAWGNNHYYNLSICNVTANLTECHVNLNEKANDYEIFINSTYLKIDTHNKFIQEPLICWAFQNNVLNVRMDLSWVLVPDTLKSTADVCYKSQSINELTIFPIQIMPNNLIPSEEGHIIVKIIDYECCGKSNIGMKEKSIIFKN